MSTNKYHLRIVKCMKFKVVLISDGRKLIVLVYIVLTLVNFKNKLFGKPGARVPIISLSTQEGGGLPKMYHSHTYSLYFSMCVFVCNVPFPWNTIFLVLPTLFLLL